MNSPETAIEGLSAILVKYLKESIVVALNAPTEAVMRQILKTTLKHAEEREKVIVEIYRDHLSYDRWKARNGHTDN